MVFTSAYAAGANCEPSRACLMSGMYGPRHGVYAVGSTDRGPKQLQRLVPIPNVDGLPGKFVTMAEALKSAGYATGHFGKWHLSGKDGELPGKQGFDVTYDSFGEGELKEGGGGNHPGPKDDPKGVYTLTRKACEFIESNRDKPFFCYLAHHAIHSPLQTRDETRALTKKRAQAANVLGRIGPDAQAAVPDLVRALYDPDLEVRKAATRALGQIGPAAEEAVAPLLEIIEQRSPHEDATAP